MDFRADLDAVVKRERLCPCPDAQPVALVTVLTELSVYNIFPFCRFEPVFLEI
jgi:hypothetical protein